MERRGFIERLKSKILPVAAVGMLAVAGCSEDKNSETVGEGLESLHAKATELCTTDAQTKFEAKYPEVVIEDPITVEKLEEALEVLESKESEGPEFMQGEYDDCMEREFDDVVANLDNGTIVPTQDTMVDTTIAG